MGKLEERSGVKTRRRELQKLVLETVAIAGVLSVAMLAPNVLGAMGKMGILPKRRQKEYVSSSASKLAKRGLLYFDGKRYQMTSKGENLLHRWQLTDFKLEKPKKWDKKWRVIIFDIPEKKRKIRDQIRNLFNSSGLYRLQDSVWIYPYDCEDIITLLKSEMGVGKNVLYLIVDELENDKYLREHFDII